MLVIVFIDFIDLIDPIIGTVDMLIIILLHITILKSQKILHELMDHSQTILMTKHPILKKEQKPSNSHWRDKIKISTHEKGYLKSKILYRHNCYHSNSQTPIQRLRLKVCSAQAFLIMIKWVSRYF